MELSHNQGENWRQLDSLAPTRSPRSHSVRLSVCPSVRLSVRPKVLILLISGSYLLSDFSMTSGWLQDDFRMTSGWLQEDFRNTLGRLWVSNIGWLHDDFRKTTSQSFVCLRSVSCLLSPLNLLCHTVGA